MHFDSALTELPKRKEDIAGMITRLFLPAGAHPNALPILARRALRALADGYIAVLLPAYLLALGFGSLEVGFISTATLIGSALATIAVGAIGHRYSQHRLLLVATFLMAGTSMGFAGFSSFWPLLKITIRSNVGTSQTAKKSSTRLQRKS